MCAQYGELRAAVHFDALRFREPLQFSAPLCVHPFLTDDCTDCAGKMFQLKDSLGRQLFETIEICLGPALASAVNALFAHIRVLFAIAVCEDCMKTGKSAPSF